MASCCRVDDLINSRKREIILGAVFVQRRIVNAHVKDVCVLLRDKYWVFQPGGDFDFSDEICFKETIDFCSKCQSFGFRKASGGLLDWLDVWINFQ